MAQRREIKPTNFFKVNRDGYLYKSSSLEEYNKGTNPYIKKYKMDDGREYYQEIYDGGTEEGYISYIGIKDVEYKNGRVKQFSIIIEGEEEKDYISFPVFRTDNSLNDYIKNIACILPNIDYSRKIQIIPSTKKNDKGYINQNLYFVYKDTETNELVKFAHYYGEKGDIPPAEIETTLDGRKKRNTKNQDNYLYQILTKEIKRFEEFKNSNPSYNTTTTNNTNTANQNMQKALEKILPQTPVKEVKEVNDDLPF